jgi:DNA-binding IclR family transcriptional regulator
LTIEIQLRYLARFSHIGLARAIANDAAQMSQSARRTVQLVEYLATAGPSSLAGLAEGLGLHKSTAFRFVSTLVDVGWAQQDPATRVYSLSPKILEVGSRVLERMEIRREVHQHLEALADASAETAHLAVLDQLEIVYIDKVDGRQAVNMASRVGGRGACHSTALGKVLLASRPESEWTRYIETVGLARRTERTLVEESRFRTELRRVRRQGYAVDDVENEEGIRCVAAPLRDHAGTVVAAMSVSGWTVSITRERLSALIPLVAAAAEQGSRSLGFSPDGEAASTPEPALSTRSDVVLEPAAADALEAASAGQATAPSE